MIIYDRPQREPAPGRGLDRRTCPSARRARFGKDGCPHAPGGPPAGRERERVGVGAHLHQQSCRRNAGARGCSFWANRADRSPVVRLPFLRDRHPSLSTAATSAFVPISSHCRRRRTGLRCSTKSFATCLEVEGELPADRRNLLRLIDGVFGEGAAGDGASLSLATDHPWLPRLFRRYCNALVGANRLDFGSLFCSSRPGC